MTRRSLALLLLALAGCSSGRVTPGGGPAPAPAPTPPTPGGPSPSLAGAKTGDSLPIRPLGQWQYSRIEDARRVVIKDPVTWTRFWNELGADGAQPVIDFRRELLIGVTQGRQPHGGIEVAVDRVVRSAGALTIEVVERSPGPDCMTTEVITHPAQVVAVPAEGVKSWTFVERKEIRSCQ